jgi:lipopolysaccharide export system permease protein
MIFWELVRVFLLSLGTLTALFLIVLVVQQASVLGLSLGQIIRVAPLLVPSMLPLTIPATTLFASCVVYGRLAHDNEVVALKAAGVKLYGIVRPALLLGTLTTLTSAALYHTTIPVTQQQFYERVLADPEEVLYNMLRRDRCLRHPTMPYVLYVRDVQGQRLIDVVIKRRVKKEDPQSGAEVLVGYDYVARMDEARLRVEPATGMIFIESNRVMVYEKSTSLALYNPPPYSWELPDSVSGKEARLKISALTWDQLPTRAAEVQDELDEILARREAQQAEIARIPDPTLRKSREGLLANYKYQIDAKARQIRNLKAEVHARPALAVSCLVFALVGCPVGIWANRADYLSTFLICFIPTLVVYYPLLLAGSDMGKNGRVPLAVGCWLADAVMGGLALLLTWRLLRR